jgi:5'(3')-deoxyribonucleotidase
MKRILIDLDGVLADCTKGICKLFNKPDPFADAFFWGSDPNHHFPQTMWNIPPAEFYPRLDFAFWANLPNHPECDAIVKLCERIVGRDNVGILTAPVLTLGCSDGKRYWVRQHLPKGYQQRTAILSDKKFCASPDTFLIDDKLTNCTTFKSAGGAAFQFPRLWNERFSVCGDWFELLETALMEWEDNAPQTVT